MKIPGMPTKIKVKPFEPKEEKETSEMKKEREREEMEKANEIMEQKIKLLEVMKKELCIEGETHESQFHKNCKTCYYVDLHFYRNGKRFMCAINGHDMDGRISYYTDEMQELADEIRGKKKEWYCNTPSVTIEVCDNWKPNTKLKEWLDEKGINPYGIESGNDTN